ncbi:YbhB/YbcL family Raf kinase inhibitor-like protein [Dermacoccaceae bacterium W4C1]
MSNLERPRTPNPYDLLPAVASFEVTSTDVTDGQPMSAEQVNSAGDTSPQLSWSGAPEGTASYVVTCFDPDAPTPSGFWHWMVVDIPAEVTSLDTGAGAEGGAALPEGAFMLRNDGGSHAFMGAAPPAGDVPHRYYFVVHAVTEPSLGIDADTSGAVMSFNLAFKTAGRAILHGTYAEPAG